MKAVMRKYGQEIWRAALSLSVFLVAVFTGGRYRKDRPLCRGAGPAFVGGPFYTQKHTVSEFALFRADAVAYFLL